MSGDVSRWPRLNLETHPFLDWVETEYTVEFLQQMAEAINKSAHPIQVRTAKGTPGVWDPATIAKLLRALAGKPVALKKLNHRRPTAPARVIALNRAVHFHVRRAMDPNSLIKSTWIDVATAWGLRAAEQVKDDVTKYRVKHAGEYRADDAARIFKDIVSKVCKTTGRTRARVLEDFDADMCARAAQYRSSKLARRKK
jgi:hypothetical protein